MENKAKFLRAQKKFEPFFSKPTTYGRPAHKAGQERKLHGRTNPAECQQNYRIKFCGVYEAG